MTGVVLDARQAANLESQGVLSDRHPAYRCSLVWGHVRRLRYTAAGRNSSRCTCSSRCSVVVARYRPWSPVACRTALPTLIAALQTCPTCSTAATQQSQPTHRVVTDCNRSFTPTVACIAACILAFFLAFVQYEHPEGTAEQVRQVPLPASLAHKDPTAGSAGGVCLATMPQQYIAVGIM